MAKYSTPAGRRFCFVSICIIALALSGCDSDSLISNSAPEEAVAKAAPLVGTWNGPYRVLNINTDYAPEAQVFNGKIHVFYRGDGTHRIGHVTLDQYGTFAQQPTLPEVTSGQPSATVYNGELWLAWRGHDGDNVISCLEGEEYYRVGVKSLSTSGTWSSAMTVQHATGEGFKYTENSPEIAYLAGFGLQLFTSSGCNWTQGEIDPNTGTLSNLQQLDLDNVVDEVAIDSWTSLAYLRNGSIYLDTNPGLSQDQRVVGPGGVANGPSITTGDRIAYRGTGDGVGYRDPSTSPASVGTQTGATPAIVVYNNRVYIFFKNDNNNELWYTYASL
jgi:hypothetical protein